MDNNFKTEQYNKEKHCKYIKKWLKIRDLDKSMADTLPQLGVICFYDDIPISAVFMRKVEGDGHGMMDSMITDPRVPGEFRDESLDLVVSEILKRAKDMNFKQIVALTVDKNTLERASSFTFKTLPHSVIVSTL